MDQDEQATRPHGDPPGPDVPAATSLRWDGVPVSRAEQVRDAVERARDLTAQPLWRIGGVAAALVAVLVWWFVAGAAPDEHRSGSGSFTAGGTTIPFATSSTAGTAPGADGPSSGPSVPDPDADVVVHAAGAVVAPGVYRLPAGSRVGDLVAVAGGLTGDADGDRLNLAEPLSDGVRVYVLHLGEPETPSIEGVDGGSGTSSPPSGQDSVQGKGKGKGTGGAASTGSGSTGPVAINDATLDQLDELPGVGPATAQAIVSHREQNGPFGSVDELLEVRGIGPAKLEQLRPLVRV